MEQYIKKSALVAVLESLRCTTFTNFDEGVNCAVQTLLEIIDTLEVKEIHEDEDIDVDLNPLFEEFGVEPDSRFASMFKEAFYKGVDRYLNKKESKL